DGRPVEGQVRRLKKVSVRLTAAALILAAVILTAALAGPALSGFALRWLYPRHFTEVVSREAEEFGLEEELVYAVIRAESGFDQQASSRAQAKGLMQLTEPTFQWMAEEYPPENGGGDVFDVNDNVHCGCALLRLLLDHYGSLPVALAAYNAGMGNVDRWLGDAGLSPDGKRLAEIPFPETAAYVEKVQKLRGVYRQLYGEEQHR
ncbi:MAG: lytic transglycosylase domain-containing protein, partial [Acutalibacter sp.]|nr:lytic transglycosylase domain-containing protein [Acutalibacter sp.]